MRTEVVLAVALLVVGIPAKNAAFVTHRSVQRPLLRVQSSLVALQFESVATVASSEDGNDRNVGGSANATLAMTYARDPRDMKPVDENEVMGLMNRRAVLRLNREFVESDEIDRFLRKVHGVRMYDNVRIWSTHSDPPIEFVKYRERQAMREQKRKYGPTGHSFQQIGGEIDPAFCSLTMKEIHYLFARRTKCRSENQFAEADAICFELLMNGVELADTPGVWRADGKKITHPIDSRTNEHRTVPRRYTQQQQQRGQKEGTELNEGTRNQIASLLKQRFDALECNDLNLVGSLTYELYKTFDVAIDDVGCSYKIGGPLAKPWQPPKIDFLRIQPFRSRTTTHLPLLYRDTSIEYTKEPYRFNRGASRLTYDEATMLRIEDLVRERDLFSEESYSFGVNTNDHVLWKCYGVSMDHSAREWCIVQGKDSAVLPEPTPIPSDDEIETSQFGGAREEVVAARKDSSVERSSRAVSPPRRRPSLLASFLESGLMRDSDRITEVENLIRYMDSTKDKTPLIFDRLKVRIEDEYGLVFDGDNWSLKVG